MSMYTAGDVRKLKRERDELLAALRLMYAMATTTTPKVGEMDVTLDAAAVIHQKTESELQGQTSPAVPVNRAGPTRTSENSIYA
jgi:hypothetical protein